MLGSYEGTMDKFKRYLEITTDIAVILAVIGVGVLFCRNWVRSRQLAPAVGTTLTAIPHYNWADHGETLLLAIRRGCHFCEESMPLYRRLADMERKGQLKPHLIAVLPDDARSASELLQSQQLTIESIPDFELSRIHIAGTPALMLLNDRGAVERVWMGQLSQGDEKSLLEVIAKSPAVAKAALCESGACQAGH